MSSVPTSPQTQGSAVRALAERARRASRVLAATDEAQRNAALASFAQAVEASTDTLLRANAEDLRLAGSLTGDAAPSPATLSRLRLDHTRLHEMVEQIRSVARLPDPLGRVLDAMELDDADPAVSAPRQDVGAQAKNQKPGLHLKKISVPLGVLAVIFEARPDAVTQIASLALKSGNAAILKPGREVERTAEALVNLLREALESVNLPHDALTLVLGREQVNELLRAHDLVDMVIPRGSRALVEYVQNNTRIPVLGHAEGVCHIYVDRAADPQLALRVIADAKLDSPAACNAAETVLVHRDMASTFLPQLVHNLHHRGVRLHGDERVRELIHDEAIAPVQDWHTEFGEPELAIGVVDTMEAAIAHIHRYGSSHTESILTEDPEAAARFLREVDAAGVFHNASTRFADGFRYGFGAEVGISTSKFHARGPVGLDGLTTYKYIVQGHGHIAADYRGADARSFTHRRQTS